MVGQSKRECSVSAAAVAFVTGTFACVTLVCRYEPLAQNGFINLPKSLKIDEGYYGKGFYFTRFPR